MSVNQNDLMNMNFQELLAHQQAIQDAINKQKDLQQQYDNAANQEHPLVKQIQDNNQSSYNFAPLQPENNYYPASQKNIQTSPNGLDLQEQNLNDTNQGIQQVLSNMNYDPQKAVQNAYQNAMNTVGMNNKNKGNIISNHPIVSSLLAGLLGGALQTAFGDNYYHTNAENFTKGFLGGVGGTATALSKAKQDWLEQSNKNKVEMAKTIMAQQLGISKNNADAILKLSESQNQTADIAPKLGTQQGYYNVDNTTGVNQMIQNPDGSVPQVTKDFFDSANHAVGTGKLAIMLQKLAKKEQEQGQALHDKQYNTYNRSDGSIVTTAPIYQSQNGNIQNVSNKTVNGLQYGKPIYDSQNGNNSLQGNASQINFNPLDFLGIDQTALTGMYGNYNNNIRQYNNEGAKLGQKNKQDIIDNSIKQKHYAVQEGQGQQRVNQGWAKTNAYVKGLNNLIQNRNTGTDIKEQALQLKKDIASGSKVLTPEQSQFASEYLAIKSGQDSFVQQKVKSYIAAGHSKSDAEAYKENLINKLTVSAQQKYLQKYGKNIEDLFKNTNKANENLENDYSLLRSLPPDQGGEE